jgi:hypothetical protein
VKIKQEEERKAGVFFALSSRRLLDRARVVFDWARSNNLRREDQTGGGEKGRRVFCALVAPAAGSREIVFDWARSNNLRSEDQT